MRKLYSFGAELVGVRPDKRIAVVRLPLERGQRHVLGSGRIQTRRFSRHAFAAQPVHDEIVTALLQGDVKRIAGRVGRIDRLGLEMDVRLFDFTEDGREAWGLVADGVVEPRLSVYLPDGVRYNHDQSVMTIENAQVRYVNFVVPDVLDAAR